MNKIGGKLLKKAFIILIALIIFVCGYEMGFISQRIVPQAYAQNNVQYQECYALRSASVGYDEFNEGNVDEGDALKLPSGWNPVGFASNNSRVFTLVCKN